MGLLYALLIGAISGWLAGSLMRGGGFGLLINILLGIVGGVIGNWLFNYFGIHISDGFIGDIVTGAIGAIVLLLIAGLFKR